MREREQAIIDLYTEMEMEILKLLQSALLRKRQTAYLQNMRRNIHKILQRLGSESRKWCEEVLPDIYSEGVANADMMVEGMGLEIAAAFGQIHQQAVEVLAENTYGRFEDVVQFIGRRTDDIYRHLALENIRGSVAGYQTWQKVAQNYREQLAQKGITGFVDKAGHRWNMRKYAEMVARTSTMECHIQGTANRLIEQDFDLVIVSSHPGACEKCIPWEDKVLSLTGKTSGYSTLDDAKADGLFHPNCRHDIGLFIDIDAEIADLVREEAEAKLKDTKDGEGYVSWGKGGKA